MSTYRAPVEDMLFVLEHVVGLDRIREVCGLEGDDIKLVLDSAGSFAAEVLAPIARSGDEQGSRLENGAVITPKGFKEAYAQYCEGGWNGVPFREELGGQGLPWLVTYPLQEMWHGANMSFGLCPMLNLAAVEAIDHHGTQEQKDLYLRKLVSGEWAGTMNLTEPQSGSDLGLIKTRAEKQADGTYRIKGQKIFITYGEHDFTPNIIHMVLARTPDAPEGTRGISLFLVPKFIPDAKGNPGDRNDVKCVSLEHKMGIHASPTCTMQFGDDGGAVGWLVGKENEGLKCMFTMMNSARLAVGLEAVAVAEGAYQHALAYARQRVQGGRLGKKDGGSVAIIEHPDVRRMLMTMKTQVEAARALAYEAAQALDGALSGDTVAQARVDLLTPIVKSWCTDMAQDVASTGIQIHGGMGFIEETGAARFYRNARIMPIYEGTNGIQAQDLTFRKIIRDGGAAFGVWMKEAQAVSTALTVHKDLQSVKDALDNALSGLQKATNWLLRNSNDPDTVAAVNVPYQRGFGVIAGGIMSARGALAAKEWGAQGGHEEFCTAKINGAQFYAAHILPQYKGCFETVLHGADSVGVATAASF